MEISVVERILEEQRKLVHALLESSRKTGFKNIVWLCEVALGDRIDSTGTFDSTTAMSWALEAIEVINNLQRQPGDVSLVPMRDLK